MHFGRLDAKRGLYRFRGHNDPKRIYILPRGNIAVSPLWGKCAYGFMARGPMVSGADTPSFPHFGSKLESGFAILRHIGVKITIRKSANL